MSRPDTTTPVLTISAFSYAGRPARVDLVVYTETEEEAKALAARFPKSARVRATTLRGGYTLTGNWAVGLVNADVVLSATGTNGGVNETGIKRYRSILRTAATLGLAVTYREPRVANAYPTLADFEAALAR